MVTSSARRALETTVDENGRFPQVWVDGKIAKSMSSLGLHPANNDRVLVAPACLQENPKIPGSKAYRQFEVLMRFEGRSLQEFEDGWHARFNRSAETNNNNRPRSELAYSIGHGYARLIPQESAASAPVEDDLSGVREALNRDGYFDPENPEDARKKVHQEVVARQGQPEFRAKLLQAYKRRCAISDCDVVEVLEAAHIIPYNGKQTNTLQNGLLLRSDLHTLMDRCLLVIQPDQHLVLIAVGARRGEYAEFHGKPLMSPSHGYAAPAAEYLHKRYKKAEWAKRAFAELQGGRHDRPHP